MNRILREPSLPKAFSGESFLQRLEIFHGKTRLGHAVWHLSSADEGVMQLVELQVQPDHRRAGHASVLLNDAIAQARALCKLRRVPLRRMWVPVEQKSQVLARSFLTRHGFHHTSTISELMKDQDVLVYVRSFD